MQRAIPLYISPLSHQLAAFVSVDVRQDAENAETIFESELRVCVGFGEMLHKPSDDANLAIILSYHDP